MCPARTRLRPRSPIRHSVPVITFALILVIGAGGLFAQRLVRKWRDDVIRENTSLTVNAAGRLALNAESFFQSLPSKSDEAMGGVLPVPTDTLEARLSRLSSEAFSTARGVKGGFWVVAEERFMGYGDPWSPPPVPTFGPPPRSYELILHQVQETIALGKPVVRVHEFETVSVSSSVFPLATVPVRVHDRIVAVAWARIHIERELPLWRLDRYLQVTVVVAVSAFLVVLLMTIRLRLEIRRLSRDLRLIERDPSRRMNTSGGMFRTIREAINTMVESLEAEHHRRLSAEEQLYQQDKMASLGRMLAGIAHQVKTPLAILKTRMQIWEKDLKHFTKETGQPPPLTEESIGIALHEIDRLSDLLRRLLFFARSVRKERMKPLNADEVIRNTVDFVKPMFAKKDIALEVNLNADGARIIGDPVLLREVFLNILSNSVDIVHAGGAASVATRPDGEAGRLVVDFTNTGPPLPPELRERVFEPFFTTRQDGTGLGLAIAYEVVHAHDGTIEFVETAGARGAHCRVTFPLAGPDSEVR
jgi:two-component system sensor histidine kinase HydH